MGKALTGRLLYLLAVLALAAFIMFYLLPQVLSTIPK